MPLHQAASAATNFYKEYGVASGQLPEGESDDA